MNVISDKPNGGGRGEERPILTPLSFLILLVLADRDGHGYGIIKEIERRTGGRMRTGTGTVYAALQRLTEDGLIVETEARPDIGDDRRRRYYSLTPAGRQVAREEAERLAHLVGMAVDSELVSSGLIPGWVRKP